MKEFSKESVLGLIDLFMKILDKQFLEEKQKAEESKEDSFEEAIYVTSGFKSVGGCQALQTLKDYIKPLKEKGEMEETENEEQEHCCTGTVKACTDGFFHEIGCLENEDQYGFFKSNNDKRPSQCTWIDKDKAERLYNWFS